MKSGLVLEGGGMRGVFTAGVLDFFLDKDINFDVCIGVSAGACNAASYISRQRGRAYAVATDYLKDKRYCSIYSLLTTGNMFGVKMLYDTIPKKLNPIDRKAFRENKTKLYACLTNCETGKSEYHAVNDIIDDSEYIRASSSLPIISRIVKINGNKYLDGAITDSVPIAEAMKMGCGKAVVVLTRPKHYRKENKKVTKLVRMRYRAYPKFVEAVDNRPEMYNSTLDIIERCEQNGKIFVIRPQCDLNIAKTEKNSDKLRAAYEAGYKAAEDSYGALKEYMEK